MPIYATNAIGLDMSHYDHTVDAKQLEGNVDFLTFKAGGSDGSVLQSYVMAKGGLIVPASEIQPGKRIRVRDYLDDLSGTGMIFLITATDYDDRSEQMRLSVGLPDNLDVLIARLGRERNA